MGMLDKYNSKQIFLDAKYGIQRVYQVLNKENLDGVSFNEILSNRSVSPYDIQYMQVLQSDFKSIDKDKNGVVSQAELNQLISDLEQKGLTYQQLAMIKSQGTFGLNNTGQVGEVNDEILQNFDKVDKNKDGRVSADEINAYKLEKEIDEKKESLNEFKASNISVFYAESSSDADIASGADEEKES